MIRFGCYFTSEHRADGDVRAFATIYFSPRNSSNPTLLFVPDYYAKDIDFSFLENTIANGYNVVIIDYTGIGEEKHFTHYPPSLDYCNIIRSGDRLYKAIPTAKDTCVFNWSKIVMRCITLIESLEFLSSDIALIGIKEGANMMWQVGGIDRRVKTVVPVINAGWNNDTDKLGEKGYELDDERERWIAACTAEAYSKFIRCPLLFLGASNSSITAFDRVRDTFDLLPDDVENNMVIASDSANQIQMTGLITLERWMDHVFKGASFPEQPKVNYEVKEGTLHINIESDAKLDVSEVVLNYAYGSTDSEYTFWNKKLLSSDMTGKSYTTIEVYDEDEPIKVFANVFYKDGSQVSSDTKTIHLEDTDIEEVKYHKERILFERKHGVRNFVIENDGFIVDKDMLKMEAGPFNIQGITVEEGYISTYIVGDKRYSGAIDDVYDRDSHGIQSRKKYKSANTTLLQFDLYSHDPRVLQVILYTEEKGAKREYVAEVNLTGGEVWQKITLSAHDFVDENHGHLMDWDKVKKMTMKNSAKAILSNMLWV